MGFQLLEDMFFISPQNLTSSHETIKGQTEASFLSQLGHFGLYASCRRFIVDYGGFQFDPNLGLCGPLFSIVSVQEKSLINKALKVLENRELVFGSPRKFFYSVLNK